MNNQLTVGGQAVIEGVMMRMGKNISIAVRDLNNDIIIKKEQTFSFNERFPFLKFPVLRGGYSLIESLIIGVKALTTSANIATDEEEKEMTNKEIFMTVLTALSFGILLFIVFPSSIVKYMNFSSNFFINNVIEGVIRIFLFLGYVFFISNMKDVQRVFEYHGAEHKAVYTYESGEELTVKNARKYSTLHPRCGTSFLLVVMVISIFVFSLLNVDTLFARIVLRIAMLPIIAGISYEFIKFSSNQKSNIFNTILVKPGLLLQKLTTREPSDSQLEVALEALSQVVENGDEKLDGLF